MGLLRKTKEEGEAASRSWDDPLKVIEGDVLVPAMVECSSCGEWERTKVLYPWDRRLTRHGEPQIGRRVLRDGDLEVREGRPDTSSPLCERCFSEIAGDVLERKRAALERQVAAEREGLKGRLSSLVRKGEEEKKALEREIADVEADLAGLGGG